MRRCWGPSCTEQGILADREWRGRLHHAQPGGHTEVPEQAATKLGMTRITFQKDPSKWIREAQAWRQESPELLLCQGQIGQVPEAEHGDRCRGQGDPELAGQRLARCVGDGAQAEASGMA